MIITNMLVTDRGIVVIDYVNNQRKEDTLYISEERLLRALEKVATDDGLVMRSGAVQEKLKKTIKVIG